MTITNEDPNGQPLLIDRGTELLSPDGHAFRTRHKVRPGRPASRLRPTARRRHGEPDRIWVTAIEKGKPSVRKEPTQFQIAGIPPGRRHALDGFSNSLTLDKQEYWGDNKSYLFDPIKERYEKVDNMDLARWYPTLVGLKDGRVMAVSGLDGFGRIINGQNEIYNPNTRPWTSHPELRRTFPTYPSLFLMPNGKLFYTGSNAGFGSDQIGRDPGIWNLSDNSFRQGPRTAKAARNRDKWQCPSPTGSEAALHDRRRWRDRQFPEVHRSNRRDRPQAASPAVQAGSRPGRADAIPEPGDHT